MHLALGAGSSAFSRSPAQGEASGTCTGALPFGCLARAGIILVTAGAPMYKAALPPGQHAPPPAALPTPEAPRAAPRLAPAVHHAAPAMRSSGHGTFPCRHSWVPRAYQALAADATALADDVEAMIALGLGKNMILALRFWIDVMRIAEPEDGRRYTLTPFAHAVLGPTGFDPYLEDIRTLWLLHWNLASHVKAPLLAWHFLLFRWHLPEICRTDVVDALMNETNERARPLSRVTVDQHVDVFLHSYVASSRRSAGAVEDGLDCPLVDLNLLQEIGQRRAGAAGRSEPTYAFRRERKPEITDHLFLYALEEYWNAHHPNELTLTFREVAVAEGSVGQAFKLPEDDLRERLERLGEITHDAMSYRASAAHPLVVRKGPLRGNVLEAVYTGELHDV